VRREFRRAPSRFSANTVCASENPEDRYGRLFQDLVANTPSTQRSSLFALHGSEDLGEKTARMLGCDLAALEELSFEDGEHKSRPLEAVAGRDVYVMHSLHGGHEESPNDKLCRLLSSAP
jgi:ribose phosphate pyrophosphokinase-like protein